MTALVVVMIMVSIGTFNWASFRNLTIRTKSARTVIVVWTHNLPRGVGIGVLTSALSFARKVAQVIGVTSSSDADTGTRSCLVRGQVFFASAQAFHHR